MPQLVTAGPLGLCASSVFVHLLDAAADDANDTPTLVAIIAVYPEHASTAIFTEFAATPFVAVVAVDAEPASAAINVRAVDAFNAKHAIVEHVGQQPKPVFGFQLGTVRVESSERLERNER